MCGGWFVGDEYECDVTWNVWKLTSCSIIQA